MFIKGEHTSISLDVSGSKQAVGLTEVWAARRNRKLEALNLLRSRGIDATTPQTITWVGDLQQGDGGKGAMVDRLAHNHHIIARTQGGDNAGHTSVYRDVNDEEVVIKTHLVPSGLRHPGTVGLLGNGVLVNPERLASELAELAEIAGDLPQRVLLSDRAHLVLPLHRQVDQLEEDRKEKNGQAIGTTRRGIGPANVSKVNRIGVRVYDLHRMSIVERRIRQNIEFFGLLTEEIHRNLEWVGRYRDLLLSRCIDSVAFLSAAAEAGYSILFEGAQGPLIDLEHGIYPYVTTSPTAHYSVTMGAGLDATRVTHRVGVLKAYQTMVGNGAFVSEDCGDVGALLRRVGEERGTTTGRPRRCGWLDLVHARWAIELNSYTHLVVTKLDVLDGLDEIGLCVGYEHEGKLCYEFKPEHEFLARCRPVYQRVPGWGTSTREVTDYESLPVQAKEFLEYVQSYLGVEVAGTTKGPRHEDLLLKPSFLARAPYGK